MSNVLGFYRPEDVNGFMSTWYLADFTHEGEKFKAVEQYMYYRKAMMFGSPDVAKQMLLTADQTRLKILNRNIWNVNNTVWNGMKQVLLYEAMLAKFEQNDALKQQLLATGDDTLAYCGPNDKLLGTGFSLFDNYTNMRDWPGQNLLGFALMHVREKLRANG